MHDACVAGRKGTPTLRTHADRQLGQTLGTNDMPALREDAIWETIETDGALDLPRGFCVLRAVDSPRLPIIRFVQMCFNCSPNVLHVAEFAVPLARRSPFGRSSSSLVANHSPGQTNLPPLLVGE